MRGGLQLAGPYINTVAASTAPERGMRNVSVLYCATRGPVRYLPGGVGLMLSDLSSTALLTTGAVTLMLVCAVMRQPLPSDRAVWRHLLVVGILLCVAPFLLFSWAEQHISSGLASIYNATTPLMPMAVAMVALPSKPRTRDRTLGLLLGFAGVIVVLSPWHRFGAAGIGGQLARLGATACYGMGFTYLRRTVTPRGLPAVSVVCVQVTLAMLGMALLAPLRRAGT